MKFILIFFACIWLTNGATRRRDFGQLPTTLSPTLYRLSIQPYFPAEGIKYETSKNFTFDANVTIFITCLDDTDNITLLMNKIELDKKAIRLVDSTSKQDILVTDFTYDNESQQVVFPVKTGLKAGQKYEFYLGYVGQIDAKSLAGLYPSSYIENGQKKWLVATQMEPSDARRVIPSFDEPFYKATFEVTIIHPTSMVAIANSMEEKTEKLSDGWSRTTFEPTVKMSTYILAMAISNFDHRSVHSANNVLIRIWSRPEFINRTEYASVVGPKILDYFSKYFNISFPLKKLDMIALPDFSSGAMENWGLITYREEALLLDNSTRYENREGIASIIAHEVAHQWFGNLVRKQVTMNWWSDTWLNEGFASYLQVIGLDDISDGEFRQDLSMVSGAVSQSLALDQSMTSHPIFVPKVSTQSEMRQMFDSITYGKGSVIIRMLNYTLSEPFLQKGLQIYLTKNSYKNTNHNDLWSALSEAVLTSKFKDWRQQPLNVSEFMNPWILQMGYPVLNVTRTYDKPQKTATITQKRFVISEKVPSGAKPEYLNPPYNFTWYVPIWYQFGGAPGVMSTWLEPNKPLTLYISNTDDEWLLVNYERAAFCRVNYDERNWRLLEKQLKTDHHKIHVKNRIQILDDSMTLAKAGQLSYEIALNITLYLINEKDQFAWSQAHTGLSFLQSMLESSPDYRYFEDYRKTLLSLDDPSYQNSSSGNFSQFIRPECQNGSEGCSNDNKNFKDFMDACSGDGVMSSNCTPIPLDRRAVIYCQVGKDNTSNTGWDLLWKLYAIEPVEREKESLLYGISCSKKTDLIQKLLKETINPTSNVVLLQDPTVFYYLSANDVARPLLWPFLEQNWPAFKKLYTDGMVLVSMLYVAAGDFKKSDQFKSLQDFYKKNSDDLGTAKRYFEQLLEKVETSVDWLNRYEATVIKWLKNQPRPAAAAAAVVPKQPRVGMRAFEKI